MLFMAVGQTLVRTASSRCISVCCGMATSSGGRAGGGLVAAAAHPPAAPAACCCRPHTRPMAACLVLQEASTWC